jgi:cytochrome bd ubiquinol oxidase subunit I
VTAAYLTTAFVVGGVGAWHLLRDRANAHARKMFSMAMWMAALVAPVQIFVGDLHGLNTLEHQPAKVMAMEGHYQSYPEGAPLILFGIPNSAEKRVDYAVEIPGLSSLILARMGTRRWQGSIRSRRTSSRRSASSSGRSGSWWAIGLLMLGLGLWSLVARWRGKLYEWPLLHRARL